MPHLQVMRQLFAGKGSAEVAARAEAGRRAVNPHYGYEPVNAICEEMLEKAPEKYRHDPEGQLRELYEEVLQRPPTDGELAAAATAHRGWQAVPAAWAALLCETCVSREFLVRWEPEAMPICHQCAPQMNEALAAYKADFGPCAGAVDVVYSFATDSDAAYVAARREAYAALWMLQKHDVDTKDAVAAQRARASLVEWLLRSSLRSVSQHAPWVRHIFVVTDTPPGWLRTSERLTVVPAAAIMPAEHLPTFNSHAVEANLHRVPGLSECYIYLNSDYLLGRPVALEDFVDLQKGQYKVYLEMDRRSMGGSELGRPGLAHTLRGAWHV